MPRTNLLLWVVYFPFHVIVWEVLGFCFMFLHYGFSFAFGVWNWTLYDVGSVWRLVSVGFFGVLSLGLLLGGVAQRPWGRHQYRGKRPGPQRGGRGGLGRATGRFLKEWERSCRKKLVKSKDLMNKLGLFESNPQFRSHEEAPDLILFSFWPKKQPITVPGGLGKQPVDRQTTSSLSLGPIDRFFCILGLHKVSASSKVL